MSFHKNLTGDDLHKSKLDIMSSSPIGIVTPDFSGQAIIDKVAKKESLLSEEKTKTAEKLLLTSEFSEILAS